LSRLICISRAATSDTLHSVINICANMLAIKVDTQLVCNMNNLLIGWIYALHILRIERCLGSYGFGVSKRWL
jgi:hypothetical protein